ncbi:artemin isoform X1 [Electrophorus electricus]|uniref:artemin isoform X1 n=1 Tax=Electrophorus electricus TaxID=8005 RepID=UPI0015D06517|nr:artemin isoform X1 [Electrophorus electricus]
MPRYRRGSRGYKEFAHTGLTSAHGIFGGKWWRTAQPGREAATVSSATTDAPFQRRNWKMVAWLLVSLLPLVVGNRPGFREDPQNAVGLVSAMLSEQPFDTLPQEEEEIGDGDSHSPWHGLFEPSVPVEEERPARWERSARSSEASDAQAKGSRRKKKKKKKEKSGERPGQSVRDCRLERREMRVRDLGMGYDSDEIVLFKFCVGSCQGSRGNYDAALRSLLANGSLPKRTARKVSGHPCCRPTSYESVSFMDTTTTWRTIESVSAANCECVG